MTGLARLVVYMGLAGMAWGCDRPAGALREVRVGYMANLSHAQAVLGVHTGELQQSLGEVKLVGKVFGAGPTAIEALLAGEVDIAYVGPQPALAAYARTGGEGIVILAGAAANGSVVVARPGAGVRTLEDLAGKRVATPQLGNTQDLSARHFLKGSGAQIMPAPLAEQIGMMERGQIDAAWVPEPWGARLMRQGGATLVVEERELWADKQLTCTVVVTRPEFLREHPEVVRKVLSVHRSWTKRLSADPKAHKPALEAALFALTGRKLPEGVLDDALGRVEFTEAVLPATLEGYAQWSSELGLAKPIRDMRKLVDSSMLEKLEVP
mgnify:CR=1 FL=1